MLRPSSTSVVIVFYNVYMRLPVLCLYIIRVYIFYVYYFKEKINSVRYYYNYTAFLCYRVNRARKLNRVIYTTTIIAPRYGTADFGLGSTFKPACFRNVCCVNAVYTTRPRTGAIETFIIRTHAHVHA